VEKAHHATSTCPVHFLVFLLWNSDADKLQLSKATLIWCIHSKSIHDGSFSRFLFQGVLKKRQQKVVYLVDEVTPPKKAQK
jgi:hypothetical protein